MPHRPEIVGRLFLSSYTWCEDTQMVVGVSANEGWLDDDEVKTVQYESRGSDEAI